MRKEMLSVSKGEIKRKMLATTAIATMIATTFPLTEVSAITGADVVDDGAYSSSAVNGSFTDALLNAPAKIAGSEDVGKEAGVFGAGVVNTGVTDNDKSTVEDKEYTIKIGYTIQNIYKNNKAEMDEANIWNFGKSYIYIGSSDSSVPSFVVPNHVKQLNGYGTVEQGTTLTPYYYNFDNHDLIFDTGSDTTVDNFYFASDRSYGSVDVIVKKGAKVLFKNSVFEGNINAEDDSEMSFEDSTIYGAMQAPKSKAILKNVTFAASNGVGYTVDSNLLGEAKVGEVYKKEIVLPANISDASGKTLQIQDNVSATSNIDGLTASVVKNDDGSYSVLFEGTPSEEALKNAYNQVSITLTYSSGGVGFNAAIPYYIDLLEADKSEDTDEPDNPAIDDNSSEDKAGDSDAPKNGSNDNKTEVTATKNTASPQTGDDTSLLFEVVGFVLAGLAACGMTLKKRHKTIE